MALGVGEKVRGRGEIAQGIKPLGFFMRVTDQMRNATAETRRRRERTRRNQNKCRSCSAAFLRVSAPPAVAFIAANERVAALNSRPYDRSYEQRCFCCSRLHRPF